MMSGMTMMPLFAEDAVGFGRRRAVGALYDELRLHFRGGLRGEDLLQRGGNEHVARHREQLGVRDLLATLEALERSDFCVCSIAPTTKMPSSL